MKSRSRRKTKTNSKTTNKKGRFVIGIVLITSFIAAVLYLLTELYTEYVFTK